MPISFTINNEEFTTNEDADMPLLWYLRDVAGLLGTKFGCGISLCGACTVQVDGTPVRSCVFPISAVAGKHITTIEGLGEASTHPVQRAWVALQVPQCGYCQSGMIMAVVSLLDKNPHPSDAEIDREITNICRCGTYPRIRRAIHVAAAQISLDKLDNPQKESSGADA
ncbi:MAG: (2Fe-2S)-binding protein [Gammaproteobacteria bacterium]